MVHVKNQHKEMKDLKKRVVNIEQAKAASNEEMKSLRTKVNKLEWRNRQLNLEVHGVPYSKKEALLAKLNEVAQMIDVRPLTMDEVNAVQTKAKPDKVPGIIVRFLRHTTRNQRLHNKKKLVRDNSIYLLENMTKQNKALLWTTKERAREKSYQFAWHVNGKFSWDERQVSGRL